MEIHKNGKLKHPYFAQAILKYGWDNIKHELLHEKLSKEEACKLEQKYIAEYKSQSLSYNITDGGEGICGFQFSEEQREKLRESHKGKKQSSETVAKRVAKNIGKKRTDEQKAKTSKPVCQFNLGGDSVHINKMYIEKYLESADEVINEVKVTKEDKKDGTLGIRSIFESIHGTQVFTVCFKKQDTPITVSIWT